MKRRSSPCRSVAIPYSIPMGRNIPQRLGRWQFPVRTAKQPDGSWVVTVVLKSDLPAGVYAGTLEFKPIDLFPIFVEHRPAIPSYKLSVVAPPSKADPLQRLPGATDWQGFASDASHPGFVPVTLDAAKFSLRWMQSNPQTLSAVAIANNQVYSLQRVVVGYRRQLKVMSRRVVYFHSPERLRCAGYSACHGRQPSRDSITESLKSLNLHVAPVQAPLVVLLQHHGPTSCVIEASLGKMPTTLVRRLISAFNLSSGLVL
jgi:hypothetical protein